MAKISHHSHHSHYFHISIPLSLAIVFMAGLVAWLVMVVYASRMTEEIDRPLATVALPEKEIPVTSVIGTVGSISEDSFTLSALPSHNPHLARETVLRVLLMPDTSYSRSLAPASVSAEDMDNLASLYRFSAASRSDLAMGVRVNVRTGGEVRGRQEVEAKSIDILEIR